MESLLESLLWWKEDACGKTPILIDDYLVAGGISRGLKWKITWRIKKILKAHPSKNHKFGKSGQPKIRVQGKDYKHEEPYEKMFKLFESISHDNISEMERYYIKMYKEHPQNDNERDTHKDNMVSENGKYYLYMVI